jgi:hypothetical protein
MASPMGVPFYARLDYEIAAYAHLFIADNRHF